MAKLTDRQRKKIVAEYVAGDGSITQRTLAARYHVSQKTVSKILSDGNVSQKVLEKKNENTMSMLAYLDNQTGLVQEIIDKILLSANVDIENVPLRDRMGALKILSNIFVDKDKVATDKDIHIDVTVKDLTDGCDV